MNDTVAHFAAKLRYETDVSDVHARLEGGDNFVLVDSRGIESWAQGRVPRAKHLPTREIADGRWPRSRSTSRSSRTAGVRAATARPVRRWSSRSWATTSRR